MRDPIGGAERFPSNPVLVVSAACTEEEMDRFTGEESFCYRHVYRNYLPLLRRWGQVVEVTRPESRLDSKLSQCRRQGQEPVHLGFLPLHSTYLTQLARNIACLSWEFPDIPHLDIRDNPRQNWERIARQLDGIIVHSQFGREAFVNANLNVPIQVVPVPIRGEYFQTPEWYSGQRSVVDCPCYEFPQPEAPPPAPNPWEPVSFHGLSLKQRAKYIYKDRIRPRLPNGLARCVSLAARAVRTVRGSVGQAERIASPESPTLELSGVVYLTVFNPFDQRKNWQDMLSAFVRTLGACADATLVLKLAVSPDLAARAVNGILDYYQRLRPRSRCKLVFVTKHLTDQQMAELTRATTYYLNASCAEGACIPLASALAAGRPAIAPVHTGLADYFDGHVGFPVAAHAEPCAWPHDSTQLLTTSWNRIVWSSLCDQLRDSYQVARQDKRHYQELAANARRRAAEYAGEENVWPRFATALTALLAAGQPGTPLERRGLAA